MSGGLGRFTSEFVEIIRMGVSDEQVVQDNDDSVISKGVEL